MHGSLLVVKLRDRFAVMATKDLERGPVAERVSSNLTALRAEKALTLAQLAEALGELGRPISVSGLSKIERGDRRVDVDDLVTLAVALDVSPNRLLLPAPKADGETRPEDIALTATKRAPWRRAWLWATGAQALPGSSRSVDLHGQWRSENRPHDEPLRDQDFKNMSRWIDEAVAALERAKAAGFATD